MALDYSLEIKQCGTLEYLTRLRGYVRTEFALKDHEETGILTGTGLSVSFFSDEDDAETSSTEIQNITTPDLVVNLRIEKGGRRNQGYNLLSAIVCKLLDTIDSELRLIDESEDDVLLQRTSDGVLTFLPEHEIWQAEGWGGI